jgi:hypothetical protein
MEGWEESQGARLEAVVAVEIGHPVFRIVREETNGFERRKLESVDPDYIQLVFDHRGNVKHVLSADCWCQPERESFRDEDQGAMDTPSEVIDQMERESWEEAGRPFDPLGCGHGPLDSALPLGSQARKDVPLASGVLDYFPAALAEVARVSKAGNDKHNPGQDMHHARGKSTDHADCLLRHLVDRGKVDVETGQRHSGEVAWRALALLQQELEDEGLAPLPRGARLPEDA